MSITLQPKTEATIKAYAKKRDLTPPEAADKLVGTAVARLGALAKYANKQKAPAKKGAKGKKGKKGSKMRKAA